MKNAVQVTILGQQYTVKSDADAVDVHRVATFVNDQLSHVARGKKTADTLNSVILALMNLAGAHLQLLDAHSEAERHLHRLLKRLEEVAVDRG
ncbi:cell division protein ZapA [Desulfuromonas sp. AOP6]|uniref:cell division protein ZapA n=1 Tax=Desulfuromonas sp. AOP6 TaxID=1566351 RepID=UPI00127C7B2D|nr:cell division protein ZapA [Desulfuromonas sp. AOP6]BCA79170.1 hypothetical protein AOP6_0957 [Desulfuromonas sp. AOP6]